MAIALRNGIWHWRKEIEGVKFQKSCKTADKRLAEQIAAKYEWEAVQEVKLGGTKDVSLFKVITQFLNDRKGQGGYASAKMHTDLFRVLGDAKLKTITAEQVQGIINKRREAGISHNTCCVTNAYWNALMNLCAAHKWTVGPKLPVMKPVRTRLRVLSAEEEQRLLTALDPDEKFHSWNEEKASQRRDNHDLLICLLDLGARYNEVATLLWSSVDLEARTVLVHRLKGGVAGTLGMTDRLYEVLSRRKLEAQGSLVFPTKVGKNNSAAWLKPALERAGITNVDGKVTLHTARHTAATRLLKGGLNIREVQQFLGHAALQSTLVYAHIETSTVGTRAANILNK